jgi:hypothetical protein
MGREIESHKGVGWHILGKKFVEKILENVGYILFKLSKNCPK